jgi:hypothetical protein
MPVDDELEWQTDQLNQAIRARGMGRDPNGSYLEAALQRIEEVRARAMKALEAHDRGTAAGTLAAQPADAEDVGLKLRAQIKSLDDLLKSGRAALV